MEEKVLFNVLEAIRKKGAISAPDTAYIKALEAIGLIKTGWDDTLTQFGHTTLEWLRNRIQKW